MKIIPRNDYVLVELDKKPEVSKSGDFRLESESVKERQRATVIRHGPGRLASTGERVLIKLNKGDQVWLFPGQGQQVEDQDDYLLIKEEFVLGIIRDEAN